MHPRDTHGRFARKPGSSVDVALRHADRANAKGAVIGGPEGYFEAARRMVLNLGRDADPRMAGLVADHAPQGILGTHAEIGAPALRVHVPLPDGVFLHDGQIMVDGKTIGYVEKRGSMYYAEHRYRENGTKPGIGKTPEEAISDLLKDWT